MFSGPSFFFFAPPVNPDPVALGKDSGVHWVYAIFAQYGDGKKKITTHCNWDFRACCRRPLFKRRLAIIYYAQRTNDKGPQTRRRKSRCAILYVRTTWTMTRRLKNTAYFFDRFKINFKILPSFNVLSISFEPLLSHCSLVAFVSGHQLRVRTRRPFLDYTNAVFVWFVTGSQQIDISWSARSVSLIVGSWRRFFFTTYTIYNPRS